MDRVTEFINTIIHAELPYDPVKAHDYYLKTRELKGRRNVSDLGKNTEKKEGWAFTKDKIGKDRKSSLETASRSNREAVDQLRDKVKGRREEIQAKITAILERITKETGTAREEISKDVKSKIAALPKAPKGLTKEQAAEFAEKRREEIAKIRGEAASKNEDVTTFAKAWRSGEKDLVTKERAQLVSDLQGSLEKAKNTYQQARDDIKAKYETELDTKFNAIRGSDAEEE